MYPTSVSGGEHLVTGGEHISRLVRRNASPLGENANWKILPSAKFEQWRYNVARKQKICVYDQSLGTYVVENRFCYPIMGYGLPLSKLSLL